MQLDAAAETEAAVEQAASAILQEALEAAAALTVGPSLVDVFRLPKERVRPARQADIGADLTCHAPSTLWRRLRARAPDGDGIVVRTI